LAINELSLPAIYLVALASLVILISVEWRLTISGMAALYLGAFVLIATNWPLEMALTKLLSGWIAVVVLSMALMSQAARTMGEGELPQQPARKRISSLFSAHLFRLLVWTIVTLVALSLAPAVVELIPGIDYSESLGGLIMLGNGLILLGLSAVPLWVIAGLLTFLTGFEVIYAAVESSALVTGLLAAIDLGLALVGSYLVLAPTMGEVE